MRKKNSSKITESFLSEILGWGVIIIYTVKIKICKISVKYYTDAAPKVMT